MYRLEKVDFITVLPIWRDKLWPGRKSEIKPMSSMTLDGTYDMTIYEKYTPHFWAVLYNNEVVGVNSAHQTSDTTVRSRGLWVKPKHRGMGLATSLVQESVYLGFDVRADCIWTVPRQGSQGPYLSCGFELIGDWFDEGMEFGPNIIAVCKI
jgi:RimJ/RimL family protein N-acetyltransferase